MDPHKIHAFFKSLFFLFLFTAISFSSFAQTRPRLAILPFTGGTEGDGETIAELFSYENELARNFTIIPRTSSIEAIMKEQQFQRSSGLTDADTIARLGRQANAAYVVAGHIQNLGASKLVLITIIHVESLRQIAGDYKAYKNIEEVQALIPAMAKRISAASRLNAANLPRLAVFPFGIFASGVNQEDAEVLAQLLATEIANSGKYAVLPRTGAIQSVIEEQKIQRSAITEPHNIKTIGNALNAQYVLAGNVRRLGSTNLFTASILQVEDASQITGNAANYNAIGDGLSKMAELSNSLIAVGMSIIPEGFVLVEGGAFQMGSNNGDSDEKPVHTVRVGSFLIGKYEVTQKEWIEIMKSNPSNFKGYNLPVENITWYEAV
jgi:TolB-like protein